MTTNRVSASESQQRLMQYVGAVIQQHTLTSPMVLEDIISVLGICIGASIGNGKSPLTHRDLRQVAIANIDHGLQAALQAPRSPIIIPGRG